MKSTILLLEAALSLVLSAGSAFAQPPNAPRRIEIAYTGNPTFIFGRFSGFVRKGGFNLGGACFQVAVRATDSAAVVAELCGTHQFLPQKDNARGPGRRWPRSEPASQQVDSLASIRGGVRLSTRTGTRMTTFVQGLAGIEYGYRHGGSTNNVGASFAASGGMDISLTNWFAYEIGRVNLQTTRIGEKSVNSLRFGVGPVFRFGEITDQSSLQP